jgi:hypothetical protein
MALRKLWFMLANVAFGLCWFTYCGLAVYRWHNLVPDSHFWLPLGVAMFLLLWFYLIREKNSTLSIATAVLAMLASMKVAFP